MQTQGNPFEGTLFYVDPDYQRYVESSQLMLPADSPFQAAMDVVKNQPTAIWLDSIAMLEDGDPATGRRSLREHLQLATEQQAASRISGAVQPMAVQVVIFNSPNRDPNSGSVSALDFSEEGIRAYKEDFINKIAEISTDFPNLRLIAIIEPNMLPRIIPSLARTLNLSCDLNDHCGSYDDNLILKGLADHAISTLGGTRFQNIYNYLDLGHSTWTHPKLNIQSEMDVLYKWAEMTSGSGRKLLSGFALNTASYNPTEETMIIERSFMLDTERPGFYRERQAIEESTYAQLFHDQLLDATGDEFGFIIDTSRNGWGGKGQPRLEGGQGSRRDKRLSPFSWCNVNGAGIGALPQPNPHDQQPIHAFAWIKQPGVSDGTASDSDITNGKAPSPECGVENLDATTGAPPAGYWFHEHFLTLVENAQPALLQQNETVTAEFIELKFTPSGYAQTMEDIQLYGEVAPGSDIQKVSLYLNGEEVDTETLTLEVSGTSFSLPVDQIELPSVYFREFGRSVDVTHLELHVEALDSTGMISAGTVSIASGDIYSGTVGNDLWLVNYAPNRLHFPSTLTSLAGDDVILPKVLRGGLVNSQLRTGEGNDYVVVEVTDILTEEGNDVLFVNDGPSSTFEAGKLNGGSGSDEYVMKGASFGSYQIQEDFEDAEGIDVIRFLDLNVADLSLAIDSDNLRIYGANGGANLVIIDFFAGSNLGNNTIERVEFADGTSWNVQDILQELESALPTFQ